jgi:hypothetical protein
MLYTTHDADDTHHAPHTTLIWPMQLKVVLIKKDPATGNKTVSNLTASGYSEQIRSCAFDGEACYQGKKKGVAAYMHNRDIGVGDKTITVIHDPAHASELLKEDSLPKTGYVLTIVHVFIKAIYSHFSRSGKKLRGLMRLAEKWGAEYHQLHHLFPVRGIFGRYDSLRARLGQSRHSSGTCPRSSNSWVRSTLHTTLVVR